MNEADFAADDADLAVIFGFGPDTVPSLTAVGGEDQIFATGSDSTTLDFYTCAVVLCRSWDYVSDKLAATSWIAEHALELATEELLSFNDVALGSPAVLPDLAGALVSVWRAVARADPGIRGNVALEGWTRLAAGGWTAATPLQGALFERAEAAAAGTVAADVFLVRSVGAALDQWSTDDLKFALGALAEFEDVESNVAFELGMVELRQAASTSDTASAVAELQAARGLFEAALVEDDRPDATAFAAACEAVATFLAGGQVSEENLTAVEDASADWLLGYLSEAPHWRQPRAETGGAWARLVRDLHSVRGVDSPGWLDPLQLLTDIGRIYATHNSSTLLADPTTFALIAPGHEIEPKTGPVPVALGPRLDAALGATDSTRFLLDGWLSAATDGLGPDVHRDTIAAMEQARHRIRDAGSTPGKPDASREVEDDPDGLREALIDIVGPELYQQIEPVLDAAPRGDVVVAISRRYTPLAENRLLTRLLNELFAIAPKDFPGWAEQLNALLTAMIQIAATTLDNRQGGQRNLPWHEPIQGKRPAEHLLSDYIAQAIRYATGAKTFVEVINIGGGDADVMVTFGSELFVIEVKRLTAKSDDDKLVSKFGDQASQYTLTGPPFAFLAVLDLTKWTRRISLDKSFSVHQWADPRTGEARPLVVMRVLQNADSPSHRLPSRQRNAPSV